MKNLPQIYFLQFFISFENSFSPYNLVNMVTMVIKFIVLMYKAIMPHCHPSAHVPTTPLLSLIQSLFLESGYPFCIPRNTNT